MVASDYVGITSGRNTPDKMEKTVWTIEKAFSDGQQLKYGEANIFCEYRNYGGARELVVTIIGE